jgi:hypothetical protein
MHNVVAAALRNSKEALSLATLGGRAGIAITAAYSKASKYPVWIAKTATGSDATLLLRKEYDALEALRPWAEELNAPHVLEWECQTKGACLVASCVPGLQVRITFPLYGQVAGDTEYIESALAWLRRFRDRVPASVLDREREALQETIRALNGLAGECGAVAGILDILGSPETSQLAPSHGDFWYGNMRFEGTRVGVFDWDSIGTRSPVHDVFRLITSCCYRYGGEIKTPPDSIACHSLLFSDTPLSRYFRDIVSSFGLNARELHFAFYCFIADSIRISGPVVRKFWFEFASTLERNGFPAPWTSRIAQSSVGRNVEP